MTSTDGLAGRVALVTGGAGAIGTATAKRLSAAGAKVAVFDTTAPDRGPGVLAIRGDVTHSREVEEAVARIEAELGSLDILVCCAGVTSPDAVATEVTDAQWRHVFAVNCDGVFFANRAVIPGMLARGYGRIVNIASMAGKEGHPMAAAYSASKAAVIAMTKSIGKEVARTGILVNSIAPAVVMTPMLADVTPEHLEFMVNRIPLGRTGRPDEVAALVAFLASEEVSFSTGACFDLSGGRAVY